MSARLKEVLEEIKKELKEKDALRIETHEKMRKAASLSKQAILLTHQKKHDEATRMLKDAEKIISELKKTAKNFPEIIYGGMFSDALQEFSEANIFLVLVKEERFVQPQEIGVPSVEYVLGLGDVVGEYRRLALDGLREGDAAQGEKCLMTMDEIFIELMALDEAYMLVPGLRRKTDVARKIIEITRGDVTQEIRRKALEDYLKKFEQQPSLKKKKG